MWIADPDFDVRRHVRRIGVPAPGGPRETAEIVGQILSTQLDRRHPLWEIWYLDGLVNGRVGFLMKYHHCLLDGVAGSGMAALLFDFEPSPPKQADAAAARAAEPEPSDARCFLQSLVPSAAAPWRVAQYGARLARRGIDAVGYALSQRPKPDVSAMVQAPRTSFNRSIGARRAMAFTSVALARREGTAAHYDVKVNDVVLALCSGALRIYLDDRGELPARTLTAGVPVSTRVEGDASLDNQISYMVVPLATDIDDPTERLHAIHRHTRGGQGDDRGAARASHRLDRRNRAAVGARRGDAPRVRVASPVVRSRHDEHDRLERARADVPAVPCRRALSPASSRPASSSKAWA